MKYEDIEKVNKEMTAIDIKGKNYNTVNERITAFRKLQPNGSIQTEIISNLNGVVVMKATIINEDGKVLGIGHSYETENVGFINKTSYIENCETSAIGRALGMCGFGIDTSLASYEEVDVAVQKQNILKMPISNERLEDIKDLIDKTDTDLIKFLTYYKIKDLTEITVENVSKIESDLFKKLEKRGE